MPEHLWPFWLHQAASPRPLLLAKPVLTCALLFCGRAQGHPLWEGDLHPLAPLLHEQGSLSPLNCELPEIGRTDSDLEQNAEWRKEGIDKAVSAAPKAGWGPQCTPRPRPCPSPGSSSLFLSSSAQEPGRKAQNTELQEAAGEVEEPGQLTAVCSLMPSFPGPRSPAPSPRPDPKFLPSAIPLRVLSSPTRGLQQPPPACGEH